MAVGGVAGGVAGGGVRGADQGQGDEGTTVHGPGFQQRQPLQIDRVLPTLEDRAATRGPHAQAQGGARQMAMLPQLGRRQRGQVLGEGDELPQEQTGLRAKGEIHAPGGAE